MNKLQILVADDPRNLSARDWCTLIKTQPAWEVCGEAEKRPAGRGAGQASCDPPIVVLDIGNAHPQRPGSDTADFCARIRKTRVSNLNDHRHRRSKCGAVLDAGCSRFFCSSRRCPRLARRHRGPAVQTRPSYTGARCRKWSFPAIAETHGNPVRKTYCPNLTPEEKREVVQTARRNGKSNKGGRG